jgi:hypothetical protein
MKKTSNNKNTIPEKNKIPGLLYVYTDIGIELPVLDITHPLFISSINEESIPDLQRESAQKAMSLKAMPDSYRIKLFDKSYIYGEYFYTDLNAHYLSGISTYLLKLGPQLIGGGEERIFDRMAAQGITAIALRMRVRDMCLQQANVLIHQLSESPQKRLSFINIAGGAASDSINTLILILKEKRTLLQNRKIEINVLEVDIYGPHFAAESIEALKRPQCPFEGLDISFNHIESNWTDTKELIQLLS